MATLLTWPGFSLVVDPEEQTVVTTYASRHWSGGGVVPQDAEHATRMGCTPFEHRIRHELAHHLVALAAGWGNAQTGCPIVWADAHQLPQGPHAELQEWQYTAFTDYALGIMPRHDHEWGALLDLHRLGVPVADLAKRYRFLLEACRLDMPEVRVQ